MLVFSNEPKCERLNAFSFGKYVGKFGQNREFSCWMVRSSSTWCDSMEFGIVNTASYLERVLLTQMEY